MALAWAWISVFFAPSCVLSSRLLFAFRFRSVWVRRGVMKTKKKQNAGSNVAARNDESATTRRPGGGPPHSASRFHEIWQVKLNHSYSKI
jgi:hypothetical protein